MPAGVQNQAAEVLQQARAESEERFVDLRIVWREWRDSNAVVLDAGGRWDRLERRYVDDGAAYLQLRLQPAQYEAAYWFAGWLREYLAGIEHVRATDYFRKWTMMNVGGRRGGKTDFCVKAQIAACAAKPGTVAWAASPTEDETIELHDVFARIIPGGWAEYREAKRRWFWANGSVIEYRSGFKPKALKRGRVDLPFFNEAQYFPKRSYTMVRAPIADTGGLVLLSANPPDEPVGQWLLEMYDEAKAGKETVKLCEFDPDKNPVVDQQALDDMASDLTEEEYRRDRKGEFIPVGDLVWHAWSSKYNVRPAGELQERTAKVQPLALPNITRQFTKLHLGREFDHVIGMDFQLVPHMAAVVAEFFQNPDDPKDPFMWSTDCLKFGDDEGDLGTEIEFAEALIEMGYDPERTAVIADASGWWQDAERTKGRGSVDLIKKAGFRFVFRPDRHAKRNPLIFERIQATNVRMCTKDGLRRLFSVPENLDLNRALKMWENRNRVPHRRSDHAHLSDALSYIVWRFWPRKPKKGKVEFERVNRQKSERELELDDY